MQKMHNLDFSYFVCELRNEGFTKQTNQKGQVWLYNLGPPSLTSNILDLRKNIKKLVGKFCAINMRIILANF